MPVRVFEIAGCLRDPWWKNAELSDFALAGPGLSISLEQFAEIGTSLYCLDEETQCACFVDVPIDAALERAPFAYAEQCSRARRLYLVPYREVDALTRDLPRPERVVFVLSVGRCGSTLLSKMFHAIPEVRSLSEPDVFYDILRIRADRRRSAGELSATVQRAVALLWRGAAPSQRILVVKLRASCTALVDLLSPAVPDSTTLFLYRNGRDVVASLLRAFPEAWEPPRTASAVRSSIGWRIPLLRQLPDDVVVAPLQGSTLLWATPILEIRAALRAGLAVHCIRYEDLLESPVAVFGAALVDCGLPFDRAHAAVAALATDSQAGSPIARARLDASELSAEALAEIARFARRYADLELDARL